MRAIQIIFSNAKSGQRFINNILSTETKLQPLLSACPLAVATSGWRSFHTQDVTKNIQYISQDTFKLKVDPDTLKLDRPIEKPLCIMINWMLARQKHIHKYASLYLEHGYDVLSVSCTPWQLMWPLKGSQLVAADVLKFVTENDNYEPMTVHGFSVAGYMWGEICLMATQNPRYSPILEKIQSQIWDSVVDISELTIGVPRAVFPKNKVMQKALESYMAYHLKHFHSVATVHYMRSSQMFHNNPCHAPALFLLSKSDPVGAEYAIKRVHDSWVLNDVKTTWKCWDRSPHVQHFTKHKEEYIESVQTHLLQSGAVGQKDAADKPIRQANVN